MIPCLHTKDTALSISSQHADVLAIALSGFLLWVALKCWTDSPCGRKNTGWRISILDSSSAAAAKSLQSCPTLCDPIDGSPPGCLGFSRQEHWSGLPFPSPMHESEKWKWSRSVVSDPQRPHGLQPSRLLYPWDFPGKSIGVGCHCLLRDSSSEPSLTIHRISSLMSPFSQAVDYGAQRWDWLS